MTIKIRPTTRATRREAGRAEPALHRRPARGSETNRVFHLERRVGNGRNVTFPGAFTRSTRAPQLLAAAAIVDATAQDKIRELILGAFQEHEERAAIAS